MRSRLLGSLVMAMLIAAGGQIDSAKSQIVPLAPGQVWSVTSESPTPVKVVIGRIEQLAGHPVVHVSLLDVPVPKGMGGPTGGMTFGHLPFDEATLAASVDQLLRTGAAPAPAFEDGYREWRKAEGGYFTISVLEAIEVAFETIRSNSR